MATMRDCGVELQGLEVDARVFPDLRIDEAAEGEREGPLMQAGQREGAAAMHRVAQQFGARAGRCIDKGVHEQPFGWSAGGSGSGGSRQPDYKADSDCRYVTAAPVPGAQAVAGGEHKFPPVIPASMI